MNKKTIKGAAQELTQELNTFMEGDNEIIKIEAIFNELQEQSENNQLKISKINLNDLDEIAVLLKEASEKIEKLTRQESLNIRMQKIPLIGKFFKKVNDEKTKTENISEYIKRIYDKLDEKQNKLYDLIEMLENMKAEINEHTQALTEIYNYLDEKTKSIEKVSVQMRYKRLFVWIASTINDNKSLIQTEINPTLINAAQTLDKLNMEMPKLKVYTMRKLNVLGALNNINDLNEMLNVLNDITYQITVESRRKTKELIKESFNTMNKIDIVKQMEEFKKEEEELARLINEEMVKTEEKINSEYNYLKNLIEDKTEETKSIEKKLNVNQKLNKFMQTIKAEKV